MNDSRLRAIKYTLPVLGDEEAVAIIRELLVAVRERDARIVEIEAELAGSYVCVNLNIQAQHQRIIELVALNKGLSERIVELEVVLETNAGQFELIVSYKASPENKLNWVVSRSKRYAEYIREALALKEGS